jgi:hypothetical protein
VNDVSDEHTALDSLNVIKFCRCPEKVPSKHTYYDGSNALDVEICATCLDLIAVRIRSI